ncbi:hypothetical protein HYFRA_00004809 [Hymenoscyphus fraxineus]|uniref:Uncharacterized protein n=1 Tax=Hymenoscyphus fraxineus TaxID=746836 RepID=A0A9N9KLK5_9HELO|nr:hypothetical protein HYFRA_00004809 [Hymenoscyphus fraxineus]
MHRLLQRTSVCHNPRLLSDCYSRSQAIPIIHRFAMATNSPASSAAQLSPEGYKPRYVDIGINLTDPVYTGLYHGTQRHPSDISAVISRAQSVGCTKLLVTGSDISESAKAIELAKEYRSCLSHFAILQPTWTNELHNQTAGTVYTTLGIHPCSSSSFTSEESASKIITELRTLYESAPTNTVVAFGELGLDYDRLPLCDAPAQRLSFSSQLSLASTLNLPLFLHSRAAHEDFLRILSDHTSSLPKRGVVHSFTGTLSEMRELVSLGWSIGINGCSLKTEENLQVVKEIPLDKLMLETDGPWCECRASHASAGYLKVAEGWEDPWAKEWVKKEKWAEGKLVKGRNESACIGKVGWVVAGVRGESLERVCEAAWENSVKMFGLGVGEGENGKVGV